MSGTSISHTGIIYIKYQDSTIFYKLSGSQTYDTITSWPVTFINLTPSSSSPLKIIFETDITISLSDTSTKYFKCGSQYIQFGNESLQTIGGIQATRPKITISHGSGYTGLIQNGSDRSAGYSNISVFNLVVVSHSLYPSYLAENSAWICQSYFSREASDNFIAGCTSEGTISTGSGGIVGSNASYNAGNLKIVGCNSSGKIDSFAGGIVGNTPTGTIRVERCWSTATPIDTAISYGGIIGEYASGIDITVKNCYSICDINTRSGGIFGPSAGEGSHADGCYSRGSIGQGAGGIFGMDSSSARATNCYSIGNISDNGGGIFGANPSSGIALNCYSAGKFSISTDAGGIFGKDATNTTLTNCFAADDQWRDVETFPKYGASQILTGVPTSKVGETWISTNVDTPYILQTGYSPYTINNINVADKQMQIGYEQTVNPGETTFGVIGTWSSLSILEISPSEPSISIAGKTGVISTTTNTPAGTYILFIQTADQLNVFLLTVNSSGGGDTGGGGEDIPIVNSISKVFVGSIGVSPGMICDIKAGLAIIGSQSATGGLKVASYADYLRYKKAAASR